MQLLQNYKLYSFSPLIHVQMIVVQFVELSK